MTTLEFCYFPSYDIPEFYEEKSLLPHIKIFSLTGFNREQFKYQSEELEDLSYLGELNVHYCITQNIPNISSTKITAWSSTKVSVDDKNFNYSFEIPFSYALLNPNNGMCFVISSLIYRDKNYERIYLSGANFNFYNSKGIFRHGLYELEMHQFSINEPITLREIEKKVSSPDFDHKPRDLPELNFLLKKLRRFFRNEMHETPLDKNSFPIIEREISEIKEKSGRQFLSIKVEFSRDFPEVFVPVLFQRISPSEAHKPVDNWNPVDEKYFVMTRNPRTVDFDKERKPNIENLARLKTIISYPPGYELKEMDSDLIWKYRFYLANQFHESALSKFVLSIRWEYQDQATQAESLLKLDSWQVRNPEIALELLTKQFTHKTGREFAVSILESMASNDDLQLYLFQLVQAIRYENWNYIARKTRKKRMLEKDIPEKKSSDLASFLIARCCECKKLATRFFWYLQIELGDEAYPFKTNQPFLPTGSSQNTFIGIADVRLVFKAVMKRFTDNLAYGSEELQSWLKELIAQTTFVNELKTIMKSVKEDNGNRIKKIDLLRAKLRSDNHSEVSNIQTPFAFPLDPTFTVKSVKYEEATLFKSSLNPALLTLVNPEGQEYQTIFKYGDDLRQDQLILQLIALMDNILLRENFDLKLSPYKVLATGYRDGFVQFLDSKTLSSILKNGTILSYLRENNPSTTDLNGVKKIAMENYTRSCAGYCVITYLLGIGDRHMDNVLLTKDGRLFHIDFGYILGNDPKIMACEVRLTRQMLDAMSGTSYFQDFWRYCSTTLISLRRYANLLITMFALVQDAQIDDVAKDPVKAVDWLKEKFCLDQTEEKALSRLEMKMTEAVKAFAPDLIEKFHSVMQFMRT